MNDFGGGGANGTAEGVREEHAEKGYYEGVLPPGTGEWTAELR